MNTDNRISSFDSEQVIENFVNKVLKAIPGILGLSNFLKTATKIFDFIMDFISLLASVLIKLLELVLNPFKAIIFIAQLVFVYIMLIFFILWHIVLKYILWIIISIIMSLCNVVYFIIACIFIAVLMLFDVIILRGWFYPLYYRWFGASENQPNAWYENGSYQRRNINDGNFYKCGDNYVADSSNMFLCSRLNKHEPRYCPSSAIYRLYKGKGIKDTFFGNDFHPSPQMMKKNINGRNSEITQFILDKLSYIDLCNTYTEKYQPLTKQLCKSIDLVADKKVRKRMSNICHEQYCVHNEREPFCSKMDDSNASITTNEVQTKSPNSSPKIYEKLYLNAIYLVILSLIISIIIKRNLNIN